jgi:hypothetical protein
LKRRSEQHLEYRQLPKIIKADNPSGALRKLCPNESTPILHCTGKGWRGDIRDIIHQEQELLPFFVKGAETPSLTTFSMTQHSDRTVIQNSGFSE